jgi:hypothetical protein
MKAHKRVKERWEHNEEQENYSSLCCQLTELPLQTFRFADWVI